jgi:signal transduction histidine kinase
MTSHPSIRRISDVESVLAGGGITEQAYAERQIRTLRELAESGAGHVGAFEQACMAATEMFGRNAWDVPFALVYLLDDEDRDVTREREVIERQAHRPVRLVDDLLDVSRIARGRVELVRAPGFRTSSGRASRSPRRYSRNVRIGSRSTSRTGCR